MRGPGYKPETLIDTGGPPKGGTPAPVPGAGTVFFDCTGWYGNIAKNNTIAPMTEEDFMREAINEGAIAKEAGEWPFGAVIVKDGKIIARGECVEHRTKNVLGHAELQAINAACTALGASNLHGCAIYCTNEPCLMCASAIIQAKIDTVVYSLKRHDLKHILRERKLSITDLVADAGYAVEIMSGVLKEETMGLFAGIKR